MSKPITLKDDLLNGGISGKYYTSKTEPDFVYQILDLEREELSLSEGLDRDVSTVTINAFYFDGSRRDESTNRDLGALLNDNRAPEFFKPKTA